MHNYLTKSASTAHEFVHSLRRSNGSPVEKLASKRHRPLEAVSDRNPHIPMLLLALQRSPSAPFVRQWPMKTPHVFPQISLAQLANPIGQLAFWRRAMGLPRINRPFS